MLSINAKKTFDNKYLILTGQKKIKAEFLFKILAKLFKVPKGILNI